MFPEKNCPPAARPPPGGPPAAGETPAPADAARPLLALSTCWCSGRHTDGGAMLREMAGLGFSHVELSHGIRVTLVPGILKALGEGVVRVASVHNFCPLPAGINRPAPNAFEPSSADATERDQWLRQTRRSLDFAQQTGARVLVAHLGRVRFFWRNPVRRLLAKAAAQWAKRADAADAAGAAAFAGAASPAAGPPFAAAPRFAAERERARKKLAARMSPYWERVKQGAGEISAYADRLGVALGFENRERPDELPFDGAFEELLDGIARPRTAGYWHDTGHAQIKQQLGFIDHRAHLEKLAPRLLGFHLHDTDAAGRDHLPPGEGEVDFDMVSRFWQPHHVLVLELAPGTRPEDVKKSRNRIEELLAARKLRPAR
ncbi:MAG: sugar phosphate isomerase/epimerase [Opitutaceae bacterium]|jgi:sugar phosphate isomerase/epimerase|nr:sugar phosphate isomerase/epimerase [Opitutaceae bacterium]